jgi:hypothetical protein
MLKPSADRAAQAEVDKGTTDIVLVVPGMDTSRLGGILETLVDQLDLHLRQRDDVTQVGISSRQGEGVGQAVVHLRLEDGAERCIELRELAWSDVRPSIGDASIYVRLARGAVACRVPPSRRIRTLDQACRARHNVALC